jgi:ArsR family transcriptional regulator
MAPAELPCCPDSDADLNSALARYARALGHPARVAILRHLIKVGACVCGDIVNELPLAQSTVSQHLKQLKEAGLIQGEIDGPRVCYCVRPEALRELKFLLHSLLDMDRRVVP